MGIQIDTEEISSLNHEQKFVLPAHKSDLLIAALGRCCSPDPEFPVGIVSSIYYDTAELHFLYEKVDSDYLKTKVRVRWYSEVGTGTAIGNAFVEAKYRVGSRRRKVRQATDISGDWLKQQPLTRSDLIRIPDQLRRSGVRLRQPLQPLITVSYERHRFVEPVSGVRVALDRRITTDAVNPRLAVAKGHHPLPVAVFEIKGRSRGLPERLRVVTRLGCRRGSFSKLSSCFEAVTWRHL